MKFLVFAADAQLGRMLGVKKAGRSTMACGVDPTFVETYRGGCLAATP